MKFQQDTTLYHYLISKDSIISTQIQYSAFGEYFRKLYNVNINTPIINNCVRGFIYVELEFCNCFVKVTFVCDYKKTKSNQIKMSISHVLINLKISCESTLGSAVLLIASVCVKASVGKVFPSPPSFSHITTMICEKIWNYAQFPAELFHMFPLPISIDQK